MIILPLYNQWADPWRNELLGTTGRTLGSFGCAMTSLAMFVGRTPAETLTAMKAVNGVMDSGDLIWTKVPEAFPDVYFDFRWSTVLEERNTAYRKEVIVAFDDVRLLLALGQPVIIRVPFGSTGHFVIAKDFTNDDLLLNDPNGGKEIWYSSSYGDPRQTMLAYVSLIGPCKEGSVEVPPEIAETVREKASVGLWKAAMIAKGVHAEVYTKELIDTFL